MDGHPAGGILVGNTPPLPKRAGRYPRFQAEAERLSGERIPAKSPNLIGFAGALDDRLAFVMDGAMNTAFQGDPRPAAEDTGFGRRFRTADRQPDRPPDHERPMFDVGGEWTACCPDQIDLTYRSSRPEFSYRCRCS